MKVCPMCRREWEDEFRVCPIDGLALQESSTPSDPYLGTTVGHAQIQEKAGEGDLGPVYRAGDPVHGTIAIQIVRADLLASSVLKEAFEEAVELASKVSHPHVIRILSHADTKDGATAVLMEYVPGATLKEHRQQHESMTVGEACRLARQIAEGALAAHRTSLLHGALSPTRVLVSPDGTARIGGFHRSGLRSSTRPEDLPYIAPEVSGIVRDFPVPDYRADVYSVGAILYELLTGRTPYEAKSLQELGAVMEAGPPLPANFSNPQVTPTLSRVLLKALSSHPSDRHSSMDHFIRELDAAGQPMREPESATAEPLPRDQALPREGPSRTPSFDRPDKQSVESIWPELAESRESGESTAFSWFKTRLGGRSRRPSESTRRVAPDDSFFPRRTHKPTIDDLSEERTAIVSSRRRGKGRVRTFFGNLTSFGRDPEVTGTGTLPGRRFSSKAYLAMGAAALLVVVVVVVLVFVFRPSAHGRLIVDSSPPGAQVYLNEEYRGNTPLHLPEVASGVYRMRLQLEGYESVVANVEVGRNGDTQRSYILSRQAAMAPLPQFEPPPSETPGDLQGQSGARVPYDSNFHNALRSRNLFPPAAGNAWETLQAWQRAEGSSAGPALEQARQSFCREVESLGQEKIQQKDFQYVRNLLEQVRSRMGECAGILQSRYDAAVSRSLSDLRSSLAAAMTRQNYVTPEGDNALKYARLILHIDPNDSEARTLDAELFGRAMEQARVHSEARQHQEALSIYTQLRALYPSPPGGIQALERSVERERQMLSLQSTLRERYSVQVKHGHAFWRECSGALRVDGFTLEYQTTGDHGFKQSYEGLQSVALDKEKITLQGNAIPGGKIELEQEMKNPNPSLAEVYSKIEEYRRLNQQYRRR